MHILLAPGDGILESDVEPRIVSFLRGLRDVVRTRLGLSLRDIVWSGPVVLAWRATSAAVLIHRPQKFGCVHA